MATYNGIPQDGIDEQEEDRIFEEAPTPDTEGRQPSLDAAEKINREARERLNALDDEREHENSMEDSTSGPLLPQDQEGCCRCLCCHRTYMSLYCQLWSKADKVLLAMCILSALVSGGITVLFLFDHHVNHGKCILAANFRPGSRMEYSDETIWCSTSMYFHVISIGLSIGVVFVNWVAQLNNNLCWQKFQAVLAILACGGAILSGITLSYGYARWCSQIVESVQCNKEYNPGCKGDYHSCLPACKYFDESAPVEEKMEVVFWYSLGEALAVWVAGTLWLILASAAAKKLMDGIGREQHKQREAQNMIPTGGYQQSQPGGSQD